MQINKKLQFVFKNSSNLTLAAILDSEQNLNPPFWIKHSNKMCWISPTWKLSVKSKSYTNLEWIKVKLKKLARGMEKSQNGRRGVLETKFLQTEENDTGKYS